MALLKKTVTANSRTKRYKQDTSDFAELSYAEQSRAISAKILHLEAAIKAHIRRSVEDNKPDPKIKRIKNIESLIKRLKKL